MSGIASEAVTLQRLRSNSGTIKAAVSLAAFQAVAARAAWHEWHCFRGGEFAAPASTGTVMAVVSLAAF